MPPAKKAPVRKTTVKRPPARKTTVKRSPTRASTANRRASKSVRPGTRLSSTPIKPTPQQKLQVEKVAMRKARESLGVKQLSPEQKKEVRKGISMAYKKLAVGGLAGLAVLAGALAKGYSMYDADGFNEHIATPFNEHISKPFSEHVSTPFSEHVSTPISSSLSSFGQHAGDYIKGATTNWNPWNESGHGWHDLYKGVTGNYGGGRRPMTLAERSAKCKAQGKVMDRTTKRCRLARGSPGSLKRKTVSVKMAKKKALMEKCRKWTGKTGAYPKGSYKAGKKGCKLRAGARMKKSYRQKKRAGQLDMKKMIAARHAQRIERRQNNLANWHNAGYKASVLAKAISPAADSRNKRAAFIKANPSLSAAREADRLKHPMFRYFQ